MYHSSTSCPCYGSSNGKTHDEDPFLPCQPADAFLATGAFVQPPPSLPPSSSCYGLQQQHLLPQVIPTTSPSSSPLIRRVLSTGDLVADKVAPMARYSAEERRERIDKYRSKRNQRNFQKKITYACRKTLADSRPRVKGRFARNAGDAADAEAADLLQAEQVTAPEAPLKTDDDDAQHAPGCDRKSMMVMNPTIFPAGGNANANLAAHAGSSGTTAAVPEWWPAVQEALAREEEDHLCDADDLLASYLGVSSINLYSYSPRGH